MTEAERLAHPLMLCIAIIYTVYVFLWIGDWQSADALIERLVSLATRYALGPYQSVAIALRGEVLPGAGNLPPECRCCAAIWRPCLCPGIKSWARSLRPPWPKA